jgi:hypothetical protein
MSITVAWDDHEHTVIRLDYHEPVLSWAEYDAAVDQSCALASATGYPLGIIHNTGNVSMPPGSAFPHVQRAMRQMPGNVLVTVTIVENAFARALLPFIIRPMIGTQLKFAHSLEEARQLIAEARERQPQLFL